MNGYVATHTIRGGVEYVNDHKEHPEDADLTEDAVRKYLERHQKASEYLDELKDVSSRKALSVLQSKAYDVVLGRLDRDEIKDTAAMDILKSLFPALRDGAQTKVEVNVGQVEYDFGSESDKFVKDWKKKPERAE